MLALSYPFGNGLPVRKPVEPTLRKPMAFPEKRIDRDRLWRLARPFAPHWTHDAIESLSPEGLVAEGYRLLLLDVDGTLLNHDEAEVPETVRTWLREASDVGLTLCVLSNTRRRARLARIAESIDVPYIIGAGRDKKPSPALYRKALARFGREAHHALMVGDQVFTDVWGANRAGIASILLPPRSRKEFIGTRLLVRPLEAIVRGHVRRRAKP